MRFTLKKLVSVLLIMLMLLNVMPISSLAGTEEPFIKLRGTGSDETFDCTVSVSVPNGFPAVTQNYGYYIIAADEKGNGFANAPINSSTTTVEFKNLVTYSDPQILNTTRFLIYQGNNADNYTVDYHGKITTLEAIDSSGKLGDYYFSWSNTPESKVFHISAYKNTTESIASISFIDKTGTVVSNPSIPANYYIVASYNNVRECFAPITANTTILEFTDGTNSCALNKNKLYSFDLIRYTGTESLTCDLLNRPIWDYDSTGSLTKPNDKMLGAYLLTLPTSQDSDGNYSITATKQEMYSVNITSQTETLPTGNWRVYATFTGDNGTVYHAIKTPTFTNGTATVEFYKFGSDMTDNGVGGQTVDYSTNYNVTASLLYSKEQNFIEGGKIHQKAEIIPNGGKIGAYTFSYTQTSPNVSTTITATKDAPYRYILELLDKNGVQKAATELGLSGTVSLVASIKKGNNTDYCQESSQIDLGTITDTNKTISGSFDGEYNPTTYTDPQDYIAGETVNVSLKNAGNNYSNGAIFDNKYQIHVAADTANGISKVSIQELPKYKVYLQKTANTNNTEKYSLSTDYSVVGTIERDGKKYICSKPMPMPSDETQWVEFDTFSASDSTSTVFTQSDVITVSLQRGSNSFCHGDITEGYQLSFDNRVSYQTTIDFNELRKLQLDRVYVDTEENNEEDISGINNYNILVTMKDSKGNTSYAVLTPDGKNPSTIIEIGGFTTTESKQQYYTGTEDLSIELVTATDIQSISNGQRYAEGSIIPELYSVNKVLDLDNYRITAKLKEVTNEGIKHDIHIEFFDTQNGTAYNSTDNTMPATSLSGEYFFRLRLKHDGNVVAYAFVPATSFATDALATGKYDLEIADNQLFNLVDSSGETIRNSDWTPKTVKYDPNVYDIDVRMYQAKNASMHDLNSVTPDKVKDYGIDEIQNYDIWSNNTNKNKDENNVIISSETTIRLYGAYKKIYQVMFESDLAVTFTDNSNLFLDISAAHSTTGTDTYNKKVGINNLSSAFIVIQDQRESSEKNEWQDGEDKPRSVSGNETFIIKLIQDSVEILEGYPVKDDNGNYFLVHYDDYDSQNDPVYDDVNKTKTITQKIILTKFTGTRALTPYDVLQEGAEYGVIADTYHQHQHTETNFAAKTYGNIGDNGLEVDASGGGYIPFYIGNIDEGRLRFGNKNTSSPDVYLNNKLDQNTYIHQDSTQYTVNVIPTEQSVINDKVNELISVFQANSTSYTTRNMMKPSGRVVDTTMFPDNITIYIDATDFNLYEAGWTIRKLEGQTLVFNIPGKNVKIAKQYVTVLNANKQTIVENLESNTSGNGGSAEDNKKVEKYILNHVVFNAYEASELEVSNGPAGLFLAPQGNVVEREGSGTGWIATSGTFEQYGSEWHFFRIQRSYTGTHTGFEASKKMRLAGSNELSTPTISQRYTFTMEELDRTTGDWVERATIVNNGETIKFPEIAFNNIDDQGEHDYRIKEIDGDDTKQYIVKAVVNIDTANNSSTTTNSYWYLTDNATTDADLINQYTATIYKVDSEGKLIVVSNDPITYQQENVTWYHVKQDKLTSATDSTDGTTTKESFEVIRFINEYTEANTTQGLEIKKAVSGTGAPTSLVDGTFTFKAENTSAPSGVTPVPAYANASNVGDKVTFTAIEFKATGDYVYKISEDSIDSTKMLGFGTTSNDVIYAKVTVEQDGATYKSSVKYYSDSNCETEITESNNVKITNTYVERGKLKITKELIGETSGSFEFTVTKNGKWYTQTGEEKTSEQILTLNWSSTSDDNSLTVENLIPGTYTVTEITDGTTYYVEAMGEGDSALTPKQTADANVPAGDIATVGFRNTKTGKITVDKTVLVNGAAPTDSMMDGTYYFGLFDGNGTRVRDTQSITISGNGTKREPANVVFDGLVPGTYVVKEMKGLTGNEVYDQEGVTVSAKADDETDAEKMKEKAVAVDCNDHDVYFFNDKEYVGSLTISKELIGATDGVFQFTVTTQEAGSALYYYDKDGKESRDKRVIELNYPTQESITIPNLKPGTYTVTEVGDDLAKTYKVEAKGDTDTAFSENFSATGTVTGDGETTVSFRNTKYGILTIKKRVVGAENAATKPTSYKVTVTTEIAGATKWIGADGSVHDSEVKIDVPLTEEGIMICGLPYGSYTVTECEEGREITDYQLEVTGEGTAEIDQEHPTAEIVLVNTYDMMLTSAAVMKVWEDDNNRDGLRPAGLTVELLADGQPTGRTVTLNAANHWTAVLKDLPAVKDSKTVVYTWQEPKVEGYTLTSDKADGATLTTLTNTHVPAKTEISVKKVWEDSNDAARKRPSGIEVQLYADGRALGEAVTLDAANGWAYTWKDLYLNICEDGTSRAIRYTVAETEIPDGYTGKTTGNASTGFVITNTYNTGKLIIEKTFDIQKPEEKTEEEEELTDFEVQKIWVDDNDNADGNRPESITVHLYAGGEEIKVVQLKAANGWRYHFGELPKYADGKPIHYSVSEDPVEGYSTEIDGFTIYNKYQPERTQATVRKIWNDENDKQKKRPESIWMKLSNGMIVMLSEENGWTATIADLPAKVNGKPAEYTWTEQTAMGYELETVVQEGSVTTFTNKPWTRPEQPSQGKKPKTAGETLYVFDEYDTPLGVEIVINHVGDCFD